MSRNGATACVCGATAACAAARAGCAELASVTLDHLLIDRRAFELAHQPHRARAQPVAHLDEVGLGDLPHRPIELQLLDRSQREQLVALERRARAAADDRADASSRPEPGERRQHAKQRHARQPGAPATVSATRRSPTAVSCAAAAATIDARATRKNARPCSPRRDDGSRRAGFSRGRGAHRPGAIRARRRQTRSPARPAARRRRLGGATTSRRPCRRSTRPPAPSRYGTAHASRLKPRSIGSASGSWLPYFAM